MVAGLDEQFECDEPRGQPCPNQIQANRHALFERGQVRSKPAWYGSHFASKFSDPRSHLTCKIQQILFCCLVVVLALMYRSGDGFRLGALHARGFEGAGGFEEIESTRSHRANSTRYLPDAAFGQVLTERRSSTLPPLAVVLMVMVFSTAKRCR